jgi:hypothetical protein
VLRFGRPGEVGYSPSLGESPPMHQSTSQLALDGYLWAELPAPTRQPTLAPAAPAAPKPHSMSRLHRRLVYRYRLDLAPGPDLKLVWPRD